jgi:PLP dependent protein
MADVAENLAGIKRALERAAKTFGVTPPAIVAVSKGHGEASVRRALMAGQRDFGENRVQEAAAKWPKLRAEFPDVTLHLIGPLQTNKVKDALQLFDVIETVDREKLIHALARGTANIKKRLRFLVQVNTGEELQKGGIAPTALPALLAACKAHGLLIEGLMCIPPAGEDPAPHFALLRKLAERHGLKSLSMGMSGDYETAAQLGASWVRVGTALFGPSAA